MLNIVQLTWGNSQTETNPISLTGTCWGGAQGADGHSLKQAEGIPLSMLGVGVAIDASVRN